MNHGLYDRYGKLTTPKSTDKDFVANSKPNFGFKPPQNTPDFSTEKVSSDKPDETLDGLREQLMALRSRGSGTSDQMKLPAKSAVELAGVAPPAPEPKEPPPSLHRGFGNDNPLELGKAKQVVSIPDPTAPANVLRAAVPAPRGLLSSTPIDTGYRRTSPNVDSSSLPVGNALSKQLQNASDNEKMVSNDFVPLNAPPTLKASTKPKTLELDLPRQLSEASREALATAEQAKKNLPVPQILQERGPLLGGVSNPNVGGTPAQDFAKQNLPNQNFAPQATPPASAFQSPFQQPVYARQQQVTSNQFFNRAAQPKPTVITPTTLPEPVRVAEALKSVGSVLVAPTETATQLPNAIKTGDGSYAPGSVRNLDKTQLW